MQPALSQIANDPIEGATLSRVADVLRALNQSTEDDFLRVLRQLQGYSRRARAITEGCGELVELLSGKDSRRAALELHHALDRARENQGSTGLHNHLKLVLQRVQDLERAGSALEESVRVFDFLGVTTGIERQHLGRRGEVFDGMADNVRTLSLDLRKAAEHISSQCETLRQLIQGSYETCVRMEEICATELEHIVDSAGHSLKLLSEEQSKTAGLSREVYTDAHSIQDEMAGLVTSTQFHDITRQRLEHVIEGLRGASQGNAAPEAVRAAACLQVSQLSSASRDFVGAIESIKAALHGIGGRIQHISGHTGAVISAGHGHGRFQDELLRGFSSVQKSLEEYETSRQGLAGTMSRVQDAVQQISGFAHKMQEFEQEIRCVSLNATVKAAQLGDAGRVMSVVAEVIQGSAAESRERTRHVLESITAVSSCVALLDQGTAQRSGATLTREDVARIAQDLRADAELAHVCGNRILEDCRLLAGEIAELEASLSVDRRFGEVSATCIADLQAMTGGLGRLHPDVAHLGQVEHYTMEREREVHRQVMFGGAGPAPAVAGEELGDNVDLF